MSLTWGISFHDKSEVFFAFTGIDPGESGCCVVGVVLGWILDMRGRISKQ